MNKLDSKTKKEIRNIMLGTAIDRCTIHKDGTMTVKQSYFYRNGMTSQKFGEKMVSKLREAGHKVELVKAFDDYRAWPKTSCFVAVIDLK